MKHVGALLLAVMMLIVSTYPGQLYAGEIASQNNTAQEEDPQTWKEQGIGLTDFYSSQEETTGPRKAQRTVGASSFLKDAEKGIDVSAWQGDIDWKKVKASGIKFAIIRVAFRYSESGTLDTDIKAIENLKEAKAAGLKVGAYIYSQAITAAEGAAEAAYAIKLVKQSGVKLDIPVVMDFEYYSSSSGADGRLYRAKLTKTQGTKVCLGFIRKAKALGYKSMVYANRSMLNSQVNADTIEKEAEIWLAEWEISKPLYKGTYTYWQYTNSGVVSGINGKVDMDYHLKNDSSDETPVVEDPEDDTERTEEVDGKKITYTPLYDEDGMTMVKASMRKGPGSTFDEVMQVPSYQHFTINGKTNKWYRVSYESNGVTYEGYLRQSSVCFDSEVPEQVVQKRPYQRKYQTTVRWNKISGASKYRIYRYNYNTKKYVAIADVAGNVSSYVDKKVKANTEYKYRVRAYKKVKDKEIYGPRSEYRKTYTSGRTGYVNTTSGLNARKKVRGSMPVICVLDYKENVTIIKNSGEYYKVLFDHEEITKTGYVSKYYISFKK